jgi:hypothetical protein
MRCYISYLAVTFVAAPAWADHAGPSTVGGGGGLAVISPDTLDEGHGAVGFRISYTRPDRRSDAVLEALAERNIHAHNTNYNLNAAIGAAYGVTHQLTVSAELPYVRRDRLREGEHSTIIGGSVNEVVQLGDVRGIGDLNVIGKYRLFHDRGLGLALLAGVKIPTGSTHRRDPDGERLETEHQPGSGSWDSIFGVAGGMAVGPLQVNASAIYQLSGKGAQHSRLGDRAQAGIALARHFSAAEHHDEVDEAHDGPGHHDHAHHHGSWDAFVEMTAEWEGRQKVAGEVEDASGGKSVWLAPGVRFNSAGGFSMAAAVGLPIWQHIRASHPSNDYRLALSIGHGF